MEVPRLGVKSEWQLPAYATATATWDLRCVCDLHHSSQQRQILNPLSEAGDQTCVLMDAGHIRFCWVMMGTSSVPFIPENFSRSSRFLASLLHSPLDLDFWSKAWWRSAFWTCHEAPLGQGLFFFFFRALEVHRLGVESELQVSAYATRAAMTDPSLLWPTPQLMALG